MGRSAYQVSFSLSRLHIGMIFNLLNVTRTRHLSHGFRHLNLRAISTTWVVKGSPVFPTMHINFNFIKMPYAEIWYTIEDILYIWYYVLYNLIYYWGLIYYAILLVLFRKPLALLTIRQDTMKNCPSNIVLTPQKLILLHRCVYFSILYLNWYIYQDYILSTWLNSTKTRFKLFIWI